MCNDCYYQEVLSLIDEAFDLLDDIGSDAVTEKFEQKLKNLQEEIREHEHVEGEQRARVEELIEEIQESESDDDSDSEDND